MKLTEDEGDLLKCFATSATSPIVEHDEEPALKSLMEKELIWNDAKTITDKGKAVAIVEGNVPFIDIVRARNAFAQYTRAEREMLKKIFTDKELDVIFYARMKTMLDLDMFTENQAFKEPTPDEAVKFNQIIIEYLAEKSTIEVNKILKMMRAPGLESHIKTREQLIQVLALARQAAGW